MHAKVGVWWHRPSSVSTNCTHHELGSDASSCPRTFRPRFSQVSVDQSPGLSMVTIQSDGGQPRRESMLKWALVFLVGAIIAALLGFGGDRLGFGRNRADSVLRLPGSSGRQPGNVLRARASAARLSRAIGRRLVGTPIRADARRAARSARTNAPPGRCHSGTVRVP